jgi:hypothetical protein
MWLWEPVYLARDRSLVRVMERSVSAFWTVGITAPCGLWRPKMALKGMSYRTDYGPFNVESKAQFTTLIAQLALEFERELGPDMGDESAYSDDHRTHILRQDGPLGTNIWLLNCLS